MIPFSILDLCPIVQGGTPELSFRNSVSLAQIGEELGYRRFWLAEHHNMPGIASAATSVVIGHVASHTRTIRVGAGGIMLPNHAPLAIAEQFGTLASLYPDRIDLGLGRAPGSDMATARALRRSLNTHGEDFPELVAELQHYFAPVQAGQSIRAVPGAGLDVPIWILGSSLYGAQYAAAHGLPFAFASHFAPTFLLQALDTYRRNFTPSKQLSKPYFMLTTNILVADTDQEARYWFSSQQQGFTNLLRGTPGQLPPPMEDIEQYWTPAEKIGVERMLACSLVGSPSTVEAGLRKFLNDLAPDELMVTGHVFDHAVRLQSYRAVAAIRDKLTASGDEI
ncbi:LLM class flavin-dependent oxidoreductase [Methylobacillus arboreus]|uniref:LLM class flavin-dependent oxidoreductase n=1 Tax=Methylobacillus arboreus TaxID=755170 RepID=UPI001E5A04CD|nr:LLM class flavin-dependent oxidoreductase [Methylobacillus arboreus]MCB5189479.1 LLM class flavin-dependent oxidoreductase [Methylobacillus arboreus]